jgi:hypothetical protein
MTSIDKSPEQYDAEAAGRPAYDLAATLALHRALYEDECRIPRLVSRQPPVIRNDDGERESQWTHTGMPTSGLLHRRIFEKSPGEMFPWVTAFAALRVDCRRHHADHRGGDRPYWRGSLCQKLVRLCVIGMRGVGPLAPEDAAKVLRLGYGVEERLQAAFTFIEQHIDEQRARAEQREKHDRGVYSVGERIMVASHHALDGLHALECPQCRRNAA